MRVLIFCIMKIKAIIAMDHNLLIWSNNSLPWNIPEDIERFKKITMGGIVVMGRNTYFSLPEKVRPLPWRRNIVITNTLIDWVECYPSIELFMECIGDEKECFIIWWASIYNQFFERRLVDTVYLTLVDWVHIGDVFVKEWREQFSVIIEEPFTSWKFIEYKSLTKSNHE